MRKIVFSVLLFLFLILCFIFNKYDLDISISLTKYYNNFFEFLDDFGELPIYFGPILFGTVYFCLFKEKYQKVLCLLVSFLAYLIAFIKVVHNMDYSYSLFNIGLCLISALLFSILTVYLFSKFKNSTLEIIKDIAILGVIVTVISFISTEMLKYLWGRVRFRDLSSDYSEFTRLLEINGLNGHKSFPSGHTNAGTSILLIALIVPRFSDKKWLKYLVTVLCFSYIFILAISRIIVSAHYASDVLCGFVVGFTTLCVTYSVLKRKGVINVTSNKC